MNPALRLYAEEKSQIASDQGWNGQLGRGSGGCSASHHPATDPSAARRTLLENANARQGNALGPSRVTSCSAMPRFG